MIILCLGGTLMSEPVLAKETLTSSYIPRAVLFTPAEIIGIKISPDSKYLAYLKANPSGVMNLFITTLDGNNKKLKQITNFTDPEIYRFFWTGDSKQILFLKDTNGAKSFQLYAVNIESSEIKEITKDFKAISAKIYTVSGPKVVVGINDRNPRYHDIYIYDSSNGNLTKIFENDKYSRFTFDSDLKIVFKEEIHDNGSIDVYHGDAIYMQFAAEDAFHSRLLAVYDNVLYYLDSRSSDTTWLKAIHLENGSENKLAHNPKSDIHEVIFVDGKPFAYSTSWLRQEWHPIGKMNVEKLKNALPANFNVTSQSPEYWILRSSEPKRIGASYYLYNLSNSELTPLHVAKNDPQLAAMIPFEFITRDGLQLTAYITLPTRYKSIADVQQPIPLIVFPHGGPFKARDALVYHPYHQWLASRGYAVLSVNFRLSSGFGKNLVNAGNGEWGGKALFDLIDGVQWCIDKHITSKEKVGIMGASYGGYATLAGLAFTPKEFAVGVDIVGPSSLITVMEKVPKYWDFPSYPAADEESFFTRGAFIKSMGGSPDDGVGREFLASRSPLNFAQQIRSPLLIIHGDNDSIVTKEESAQIYAELKRLHKKVCYLSFHDEGHQIRRYANTDVYLAYAEKWLHDVLGGAYEPINTDLLKESSVKVEQ